MTAATVTAVSVREFSHNPSAILARVEHGETIEVTRHGTVIAVLVPRSSGFERYADLVSSGAIRLAPFTTSDLPEDPPFPVPGDLDPVELLLAEREADPR